MKKSTFNIRANDGSLDKKLGYFFSYPDLNYEFAVYQTGNSINSEKRWVVIEFSTGLGIGGNDWTKGKTRKGAIAEAKELLDRIGSKRLKQGIFEVINGCGAIKGKAN